MKTIAVLSQKGGSGKTTLSLHLAVAAYQDGNTVLVADCDEQASATMWHHNREDKDPHVQPTHSAALPSVIKEAERQGVDFLIIDTAPQSDKPAINAAEAADFILITCEPSIMDLRAIQNTVRLTQLANLKPGARIFTILTKIEHFGDRDRNEAAQVLEALEVDVLPFGMGRRVAYRHSLIDGRTALEYEPDGKAAQEVRTIYQHIKNCAKKTARSREVVKS